VLPSSLYTFPQAFVGKYNRYALLDTENRSGEYRCTMSTSKLTFKILGFKETELSSGVPWISVADMTRKL
jgi:hypothetical protein